MLKNPALIVRKDDNGDVSITMMEPLEFTLPPDPPAWKLERQFYIPAGFVSDGASVPRFFWRLLSPQIDPVTLAPSLAHDWLYEHGAERGLTKQDCDIWYHDALVEQGYPMWKADLTFIGVFLFGWRRWRSKK